MRDDFWTAAHRFMQGLEIRLVEGENSALVDLFDDRHARKVLAAFGRAYGALPEKIGDLSRDQESFLDKAVSSLAQDGKVVPVRLALFAEMVKTKPWVPATLREAGGAEGVGVTFLEETFAPRPRPRTTASTRRPPRPSSRPSCPRPAPTSRAGCAPRPSYARPRATPPAAATSTT